MKKIVLFLGLCSVFYGLSAAEVKAKGNITAGSTFVESAEKDADDVQFGGAYLLGNVTAENEYLTACGKIYYRLNETDDASKLSQKLDVKRAFVLVRPFGNEKLEVAGGKLYSYYLPGNYFSLAEIYTGSSRWGKTGAGVKTEFAGITLGAAVPLTESYVTFDSSWGVNGAAGFDFKKYFETVPVKIGWDFIYTRTKQTDSSYKNDFAWSLSANYAPKTSGFVTKINVTGTYSANSEPLAASSVYKFLSNYSNSYLKKSNFASVNFRSDFGKVQFTLEGEAGHSTEGSMIPLYAGTQLLIPVVNHFSLKPRFFYYAALDDSDSDKSRQTFEVYPRIWLVFGNWTVSAGYDFYFKQTTKDSWNYEWKVPAYVEYKFD